jgi:hypothetical protein
LDLWNVMNSVQLSGPGDVTSLLLGRWEQTVRKDYKLRRRLATWHRTEIRLARVCADCSHRRDNTLSLRRNMESVRHAAADSTGQSVVRIPVGLRFFSLLQKVETGSGAHPSSILFGT